MEHFFETKQLQVGYEKKIIVDDINISLKRGEILSLIGPNGAGKTTVLRSVINQLMPIGGTVLFENMSIGQYNVQELAKKMSVLLTERIRTELMSVEEVVGTGRYPYTGRFGVLSKKDRDIVADVMALTRIEDIKNQDFMKISDGQRQRVMLARALAQEPEIMILDEPTSFLDIRYKMEFLSLLQKLAKEKNMTIIISLHEVELAGIVSDRVACFRNGKMDRFGVPKEVLTNQYLLELYDIELKELTPQFRMLAEGYI